MTTGAYTLARRPPNWLRTAGVASTRSEPSGSPDDGRNTRRFAGGMRCACRAAHIAGSHATIAPALACRATQAAAWPRTAADRAASVPAAPAGAPWAAVAGPGAGFENASVAAADPAAAAATATVRAAAPNRTSRRRTGPRRAPSRPAWSPARSR